MPGELTEVTELATALGMVASELRTALIAPPPQLRHVPPDAWERLVAAHQRGEHRDAFRTAFGNGRAFLAAEDGLRGRLPRAVEWKGPHRPPGDDVVPADLRVDHVYLVSCKYLSKVLLNAGPSRLFDRLLTGDRRAGGNWFAEVAPAEFQDFYEAAAAWVGGGELPPAVVDLDREGQRTLREALRSRDLPGPLRPPWRALCRTTSERSAERWAAALSTERDRLRLLWRLLRIGGATYFVLGTDRTSSLRLRVVSDWDWMQAYRLADLVVTPRSAGQPEVGWEAHVEDRATREVTRVQGHVEVRWSHGRFIGSPEAKVYLDTPHHRVPGYVPLV